jgi:hypothetical protein
MKRIWIMLFVVAFGVAIATPATAKVDCNLRPDHPTCQSDGEDPPDDGPVGMTCVEADAALRNISHVVPTWLPSGEATQQPGDLTFEVILNDRRSACVDVMSAAGAWRIDVVTLGSADGVALAVGDSVNPGDACWGGCHGDVAANVSTAACDGGDDGESCKVVWTPELPESYLDSCGLWVGDNGFADGDPQMAFTASYSGVKKLSDSVVIEVTLP